MNLFCIQISEPSRSVQAQRRDIFLLCGRTEMLQKYILQHFLMDEYLR
jgi:hypothetical protein